MTRSTRIESAPRPNAAPPRGRGRRAGADRRRVPAPAAPRAPRRRRARVPGASPRQHGVGLDQGLRELELDPQRHQPLLGAVVQVALDPSALSFRAGSQARARELQLAQRRLGLGREPLVLEHDSGHRDTGLDQLRACAEAGVVDDRRHDRPALADLADGSCAARARGRHGLPPAVHPPVLGAAVAENDLDRRVVEGLGKGPRGGEGVRERAQALGNMLERRPREESPAQQADEERERDGGNGDRQEPRRRTRSARPSARAHAPRSRSRARRRGASRWRRRAPASAASAACCRVSARTGAGPRQSSRRGRARHRAGA